MEGTIQREATVPNAQGIHARPSQAIVKTAQKFDATVQLSVGERSAAAQSILSVMTLGAVQGSVVRIEAKGPQAEAAAEALAALIDAGFAES